MDLVRSSCRFIRLWAHEIREMWASSTTWHPFRGSQRL
jgi:hypothetical protein